MILAASLGQVRGGGPFTGTVRALVNDEQHIALFHQFPFLEAHLVDVAADTGTQVHGFRCRHPAGEVIPQCHRVIQHLRHLDRRRRHLRLLLLTTGIAAGQSNGHHQYEGEPDDQLSPAGVMGID